jgi:hypothetical protein
MTKWADYGISKVRYNKERTHTVKVKVREDKGNTFGPMSEMSRSSVVESIESGTSFVTLTANSQGGVDKGKEVHVVVVNGVKYIRTDSNKKTSDNLENLPEF